MEGRPAHPRAALAAVLTALVACGGVAAQPAGAMTRTRATRAALAALDPARLRGPVVVFGMPGPLRRGSDVIEAGPGPTTIRQTHVVGKGLSRHLVVRVRRHPLRGRAWLFWEDLVPGALFEHPSVMVLIDDRSGRVIRRQPEAWYPLVNGRVPPWLRSPDAYASSRYRVYDTQLGAGARALAASALAPATLAPPPRRLPSAPAHAATVPNLHNDCMVTIGYRDDGLFHGDFKLLGQVASALDLTKYAATDAVDLNHQIDRAQLAHCKDVLIAIAAHGYPATGTNYTSNGQPVPTSPHAQVELQFTERTQGGFDYLSHDTLDATQVRRIMARHPKLTFKLVVSACFSGRWTELRDVPNLRVIATGARSDQFGWGWGSPTLSDGSYYPWPIVSQTNGVVTPTGGTIEDHTNNPTHATTFTNGIYRALLDWANSDRATTGDDLAKGIVEAFGHESENDFSAQDGAANPQLGDYTNRPAGGAAPVGEIDASVTPDIPAPGPPTHPKVGESITFHMSGSEPGGSIRSWRIDFGDGASDSDNGPPAPATFHAYDHPGVYEVRLTVTDDLGDSFTTDPQFIYVSGPGTKAASLTDIPCSSSVATGGYVDINIPSYAQNPTASLTSALSGCLGKSITNVQVTFASGPAPGSTEAEGTDEWQRPKNHLHVTFDLTGTDSGGTGSATFTASWN